jgi:hypothetical protein
MRIERAPVALFLVSLALRLVWLPLAPFAFYPDAAYYEAAARSIAAGRLEVPFLWSWIETGFVIPETLHLPLPAFPHWGPLASLVGAPFVALFGALPFASAIPHLLASAALAPLTYLLARRLGVRHPLWAGVLAAGGGLYGPLLSQPDNYALYALLAIGALWTAGAARGAGWRRWGLAGLLAGFAWLSRTDGLILAGSIGLLALAERGLREKAGAACAVIAGFALPALPWIVRQVATFGSAIPSGSSGAIWIRTYNEQFTADGAFSPGHLFADGLMPVIESRIAAIGDFLSIGLVALFLFPFIPALLASIWQRRRERRLAPFAVYAIAYAAWSILFAAPHLPGGNLMHGLVALAPIAWLLATDGVAPLLAALERRGLLRPGADRRMLAVLVPLIVIAGFSSSLLLKVPVWREQERLATETRELLEANGYGRSTVMSTSPAPLWRAGIERTVFLPLGPERVVERAIRATGAGVVVLDPAYQGELAERWAADDRPAWLGEPIELPFDERGEPPRTLLIFPVLATPPG